MKVNVTKSTKGKFSALEAGTVLHVTSTYHGVEDKVLMVVNMGEGKGFSLLDLETGIKSDLMTSRLENKIYEDGLTQTINELDASGKYIFTKVKAELNVEV